MMKQLKIKDNSRSSKDLFFDIPHLVKSISDKTLGELEKEGVFVFPEYVREADDLSDDQMIIRSVNDDYYSGNVMGFLGRGDERLIIESRFSIGGNDFLFQYLLERVMDFPNLVNYETDATRDNKMFALLLFLFPAYLSSAMRKGIFKTYVNRKYNDANVRGMVYILHQQRYAHYNSFLRNQDRSIQSRQQKATVRLFCSCSWDDRTHLIPMS